MEDEVQIDKEISTATINASSMEDEPMKYEDVLPGMWVLVRYEEERFLGKVTHKKCGEYYVRCLDKPFGKTFHNIMNLMMVFIIVRYFKQT